MTDDEAATESAREELQRLLDAVVNTIYQKPSATHDAVAILRRLADAIVEVNAWNPGPAFPWPSIVRAIDHADDLGTFFGAPYRGRKAGQ